MFGKKLYITSIFLNIIFLVPFKTKIFSQIFGILILFGIINDLSKIGFFLILEIFLIRRELMTYLFYHIQFKWASVNFSFTNYFVSELMSHNPMEPISDV